MPCDVGTGGAARPARPTPSAAEGDTESHDRRVSGRQRARRLPVGAEVLAAGMVHVRVWAPGHRRVAVVLEDGGTRRSIDLLATEGGYFAGVVEGAGHGSLYRFRLD